MARLHAYTPPYVEGAREESIYDDAQRLSTTLQQLKFALDNSVDRPDVADSIDRARAQIEALYNIYGKNGHLVPAAEDLEPEELVSALLDLLPERERQRSGLEETPHRVARMWLNELTVGYGEPIKELFKLFPDEGDGGMVVVKDIPVRSVCEHHLVPFVGYAHIGYFPNGNVIGLSKLPRVVDAYARRLQIQERLTKQIIDAIDEHLEPRGTMVVVKAEHMCMSLRGVQAPGTQTITSAVSGMFQTNEENEKEEFLRLVNGS